MLISAGEQVEGNIGCSFYYSDYFGIYRF